MNSKRGIADRLLAAGAIVVVAAILIADHSTPAAASPILNVHTNGSGGVVVDSPTITTTGVGKVTGVPDTLVVEMSVSCKAAHASDALSQAEQNVKQVLASFASAGVDPKDLSTAGLSIQPSYTNDSQIDGYTVDESVSATLRDLSKAGAVLDAAARSAGDSVRVDSMNLSISDTSPLLAKARQDAVADARAKADQMAQGGGVKVAGIKSLTDQANSNPQPVPWAADSLKAAGAAVPVSPGSQQLEVDVTAVFNVGS